jgi:hypothetical protein
VGPGSLNLDGGVGLSGDHVGIRDYRATLSPNPARALDTESAGGADNSYHTALCGQHLGRLDNTIVGFWYFGGRPRHVRERVKPRQSVEDRT